MGSLLGWSVQQLQRDLARKAVSAEETFAQCIARAKQTENLNAFVTLTEELGAKQAVEVDAALSSGRHGRLPLAGVPVAVKDNFCVRGVRTTCGSRMLKSFTPPYSATVVDRLVRAGAILVGKTNLDEFGMGSGCVDSVHGATSNAWNAKCVSGGSSGGSAVAVAVGAAVAALGSDTGGSTRNPASYNGVVGLKPSYGAVSRVGLVPLVNSMDVPGIFGRSVDDVASVLNVVSGWDKNDATTVQNKVFVNLPMKSRIDGLRIGIPVDYLTEHLSDEVVSAWRDVASRLEAGGAAVEEVRMPHTRHSIAVYSVLNQCEVASNMARYTSLAFGLRGDSTGSTEQLYAQSRALGLGDVVRRRVLCGNYFLLAKNYSDYFLKALQVRRRIVEDFNAVWASGIDMLLTPVTLSDAPTSAEFMSRDARAQSADQDFCTQPANMAGVPAVALPVRLSSRGLPLSLQLIAPPFHEEILLGAASFIEEFAEFHRLRCGGTN